MEWAILFLAIGLFGSAITNRALRRAVAGLQRICDSQLEVNRSTTAAVSQLTNAVTCLYDETSLGYVHLLKGKLTKSTKDAACWDIHSDQDVVLNPGEQKVIPTGVVTEMFDVHALILDRSGLAAKFEVTRRAGVIDSKYPEEWGVVLRNEGKLPYQVRRGDRIAQVLFIPNNEIEVMAESDDAVVETTNLIRDGGFGSTGK